MAPSPIRAMKHAYYTTSEEKALKEYLARRAPQPDTHIPVDAVAHPVPNADGNLYRYHNGTEPIFVTPLGVSSPFRYAIEAFVQEYELILGADEYVSPAGVNPAKIAVMRTSFCKNRAMEATMEMLAQRAFTRGYATGGKTAAELVEDHVIPPFDDIFD